MNMTARDHTRIINKQRNLPGQLKRARRRVKQLEAECVHYGMKELLENPEHLSRALENEAQAALAANTERFE